MSEKASLLVRERPVIDAELWAAYSGATTLQGSISDNLTPSSEILSAEKTAFYGSNMTVNPNLRPRQIDVSAIGQSMDNLYGLKQRLPNFDADPSIVQAYRWRINEELANLHILDAVAEGNARRFARFNHFIYGTPNADVFQAVSDEFSVAAEQAIDDKRKNKPAAEAAHRSLELIADWRGDRSILRPSDEVFEAVRSRHFAELGFYSLLFAGVTMPTEGKVDQAMGDPMLEQIIKNTGGTHKIVDATGKAWSLDNARHEVRRPNGYNFPYRRFIGLPAGHEVGSHLLEYTNGMRGPIRLLSQGFDRLEIGNEGRAVIREQIVYPTFDDFAKIVRWQDIMRRHFATALADGVVGETEYKDVYQVINAIDTVRERARLPDDIAKADQRAHDRTWHLLESIYKGTQGVGAPYGRYAIYLEGNLRCWQAETERAGRIEQGDVGKFDIANVRHMAILEKQGVLPSNAA